MTPTVVLVVLVSLLGNDASVLECDGLGLESLPSPACPFQGDDVTTLSLRGNALTHLTDADALGGAFPWLTTLLLDDNALDTLWGVAFDGLPGLANLSLHGNRLGFLGPDLFLGTTALRVLDLSSNRIEAFHRDVFRPLKLLEVLDVSENLLTVLPVLWTARLRTLDASHNRLACGHVTGALRAAWASLRELDLSGNELQSVDLREPGPPELRHLRLGNNPWRCDCALAPLRRFLAAGNLDGADAACALPPELHGDAMVATVAAMTCEDDDGEGADEDDGAVEVPAGHARQTLAVTGVAVAVVVGGVVTCALGVAAVRRLQRRNVGLRLKALGLTHETAL